MWLVILHPQLHRPGAGLVELMSLMSGGTSNKLSSQRVMFSPPPRLLYYSCYSYLASVGCPDDLQGVRSLGNGPCLKHTMNIVMMMSKWVPLTATAGVSHR